MSLEESNYFQDYRTTNDGVMVADVGFKKQLWALDPELDVVWSGSKWEIWRFPGQGRVKKKRFDDRSFHMLTVQTQGRTFRELGADILVKLQASDPTRFSLKQLVDYFDQLDANMQRTKERELINRMADRKSEVDWFFRGLRVQVPKRFQVGQLIQVKKQPTSIIARAVSNA